MSTKTPDIEIRTARWPDDRPALRCVREEVFVREQRVPLELEWDEEDAHCLHLLACLGDTPVATARMLPDGHIGRMAVRSPWRGRGIGSALLTRLIDIAAQRGLDQVWLNAQVSAVPFYRRFGFNEVGRQFLDAGIDHLKMIKQVEAPTPDPSRTGSSGCQTEQESDFP